MPPVLQPALTKIDLKPRSFNWNNIVERMWRAEYYSVWVDETEQRDLNQLGGALQGLLKKALNEKYGGKCARDCIELFLFSKIMNEVAERKDQPFRCVPVMQNPEAAFPDLVIRKVEVRTHFGDPTQKYTSDRVRKWKDISTRQETEYFQSRTTQTQRATKKSRISEVKFSIASSASTDAFSYAPGAEADAED